MPSAGGLSLGLGISLRSGGGGAPAPPATVNRQRMVSGRQAVFVNTANRTGQYMLPSGVMISLHAGA